MRIKALSCFLSILLVFSLCSCEADVSCPYILSRALAVSGEDTEGNGLFYFCGAQEGEAAYFSSELCSLMYGSDAREKYFVKIEDFAIFISQRTVGELAVFKCYSRSDADRITQMCLTRADLLKVGLRNSEYEQKSRGIEVFACGDTVVLCFVENAKKTREKIMGLL